MGFARTWCARPRNLLSAAGPRSRPSRAARAFLAGAHRRRRVGACRGVRARGGLAAAPGGVRRGAEARAEPRVDVLQAQAAGLGQVPHRREPEDEEGRLDPHDVEAKARVCDGEQLREREIHSPIRRGANASAAAPVLQRVNLAAIRPHHRAPSQGEGRKKGEDAEEHGAPRGLALHSPHVRARVVRAERPEGAERNARHQHEGRAPHKQCPAADALNEVHGGKCHR
mmetsp:Transcript_1073/g.3160  ORF Transcript_1073/g.3160 Transcript_1073/m.3160 type:complete len:227 (-) Transcript_1073:1112-1792(-)